MLTNIESHKKKYLDLYLVIFSSLIFFLPLNFFGLSQIEEYGNGIYSAFLLFKNFNLSDYFSTFNGLISTGVNFPLGQGLFFYPSSLLLFNFKIFYISTIFFNLFIQFYFLKKIIYIITNKKNRIIPFILLFNLSNFSYLYFNDWISCFTTFTLYFPILHYSLKFQKKNCFNDLIKIIFFLSIIVLNGHLGFYIYIIYFLILFSLINYNFSYLNNKYFYLILIIFLTIISERFYDIVSMYFHSINAPEYKHDNYIINDYMYVIGRTYHTLINIIEKIFNIQNIHNSRPINGREVIYGLSFLISIYYSVYFLIKKKSKKIYYLNILFFIFILISLLKYEWLPKLSGTWQARDIILILGLVNLSLFLLETNKKLYYAFLTILIINNFFIIIESSNHLLKHGKFKIDNINQTEVKFLNDININKNNFQRIYLSPKIFNEIKSQSSTFFIENGIYKFNDFIKYNLYPINYIIKNQKNSLREINFKMYTEIDSNFSEINNSNFLDLFLIDFILIKKEELKMIDQELFFIKSSINNGSENYVLLEKKEKNYLILNDMIKKHEDFQNCKISSNKAICLLNQKHLSKNNNLLFKMINHDLFLIENKNNYDVYFVPPFMDADYKIKNNKYLSNLNDNFSLIFLKAQSSQELKIENNLKKKLRLLSLISLLLLLLIMFNKKLKIYKQDIIKMLK